jgi:hypothetical protein
MYCCDGFSNLIMAAGERGNAALAVEKRGRLYFLLQSRGVAFEDESKLRPASIEVTINIASCTGLRFCPFCGRKLEELIQDSPDFFENLAAHHEKFLAAIRGF